MGPLTIRRHPSDFRVIERPDPAFIASLAVQPSREARYAIYELAKIGLATPEAASQFARALGTRAGMIQYAGLKDKHAETTQLVAAPMTALRGRAPSTITEDARNGQPHGGKRGGKQSDKQSGKGKPAPVQPKADEVDAGEAPAGEVQADEVLPDAPSWSARLLGFATHELDARAILGNRFEIIVRSLDRAAAKEMDRRASLLASGHDSLRIINYYGAQRFGSARHGQGFVARRLIEADFEGALRLAIATPARKDVGKVRVLTRTLAQKWGAWPELAKTLPPIPERRAIEALAKGASFKDAFTLLPYFTQAMYVEAYQSHLWNDAARRIALAIAPSPRDRSSADDEFGVMEFPRAHLAESRQSDIDDDESDPADDQAEAGGGAWSTCVMPVLAKGSVLAEPWGRFANEALKAEGITIDQLTIPGLRRPFFGEADRPLFVEATDFALGAWEADEEAPDNSSKGLKRHVVFDLPRGAYATVVLRALGQ